MKKHFFIHRFLWVFIIFLVAIIILINSGCGDYYGCDCYNVAVGTPEGPSVGYKGTPVKFSITPLERIEGCNYFKYIFNWDLEDTSVGYMQNGKIYGEHTYRDTGRYNVFVTVYGGHYTSWVDCTTWSSIVDIHIIIDSSLTVPATPSVPSGDTFGYTYISYTFSSHTIDPQSEDIAIRFDWGDGDTSSFSDFEHSGQTIQMSHIYYQSGTYYIKAQAKDINNILTEWSDTHIIKIVSKNPYRWDRIRRR